MPAWLTAQLALRIGVALQRAAAMNLPLFGNVGGMRFFGRREYADMAGNAGYLDARGKPARALEQRDAKEPAPTVVRCCSSLVFQIGSSIRGTQVADAVVSPVPIDVVDVPVWPKPMKDSEGHAVGSKQSIEDGPHPVALAVEGGEGLPARISGVPVVARVRGRSLRRSGKQVWRAFPPKQPARIRLIAEQLAAQVGRDISFSSHAKVPFAGQGRALLTQRFRPVFSIRSEGA